MARTKKEQMQMLIMGAILAAGALFAAVNFLLAPMINNWKKHTAQTLVLQAKLDAARAVVRGRADILARLTEERRRLAELTPYLPLPVLGNYLLGMNEQVRQWAAASALDIVSVLDEGTIPLETSEKLCQVYAVRVAAEGNLSALAGFLAKMEEENPMVAVSALSISARPEHPNRHDIRLVLDWLVWRDSDNLPAYAVAAASDSP